MLQQLSNNTEPLKTRCIEVYALHEFGHALGLAHELERVDAESCELFKARPNKLVAKLGDFDLQSIMNYCANFDMIHNRIARQLSLGDLEAINKVFSGEISFSSIHSEAIESCLEAKGNWKFDLESLCCEQVVLEETAGLSSLIDGEFNCKKSS